MADLYKVKDITTGKFLYWTLPQVLGEITSELGQHSVADG